MNFRGIQYKEFEPRGGHILPAIENVKGKYCLFGTIKMFWSL
jgi:hypothetical protein